VKESHYITELKFCDGVPWKIDKAYVLIVDLRSYKYCRLIAVNLPYNYVVHEHKLIVYLRDYEG
jgi:hypothetical protein